ncbi:uncharacterized protein LOC6535981 [Drosophila yakuba]|uniref:Uncharacterized protein n=1 Tax=Drosophila yakuba TaxID=7245 RepID=A0A0R1EFA7_DROYA|nr:uncharacterized protein LOC6535981 [Drosophila yakuba]KRK05431.1 uncharacterized protein Dyak_GE27348 [Drosophila yakuba]
MENFSLQQLIDLQNIQKELNSNKDTYLKTYRQVLKKKFRSELNNLVRADFNIVKSELKVPQLPPLPAEDENTTSAVQFSDIAKDYEFTKDCLSLM